MANSSNYNTSKTVPKQPLARTAVGAFAWNHGLFLVETAFSALTTYVLARYLEAERYGIYTAVMAFAMLALMIVSFGYEGALNVFIPRLRSELPKIRYLTRLMLRYRLLAIAVLMTVVWGANECEFFSIYPHLATIGSYLPLAMIYGSLNLGASLVTSSMVALMRVKGLAIIRVILLGCLFFGYWCVLSLGMGVSAVLWVAVFGTALATVAYALQCRDVIFGQRKAFETKDIFKFSVATWSSSNVGYLLGKNLDIVLLSFFNVAKASIGLYQITFVLIDYSRKAATKGMSGVAQAAFASAYQTGGLQRLSVWWRILIKFEAIVTMPGVLFLIIFADPLLQFLLPDYIGAVPMIQLYGTLVLVSALIGGSVHVTAFYAMGMGKTVLYFMLISGLINLLLDIVMIYFFGAMGALLATGISGIVMGILSFVAIKRLIPANYPKLFALKCIICLLTAGGVSALMPGTGVLRCMLGGISLITTYIVIARIIGLFDQEDLLKVSTVSRRLEAWLRPFSRISSSID